MADTKVVVQYGDLVLEESAPRDWVVRGPGTEEHFQTLLDALTAFDSELQNVDWPKAQIVWPSDRDEALRLLASNGIEEFAVTVDGGLAILDHHWIPCEFLEEYGGNIDAHLEVVATAEWTTGSRDYYQYQDFYIVSVWHAEKGSFFEIDYELPEDEDYDEVDDGEIEFARFIGLNKLDREEWFDLPEDAVKLCDLTSWWEYGECEIAELAVYSSDLDSDLNVLVADRSREKVIGKFASLRDVVHSMTIDDGVRYNLVSDTLDEWWGWNLGSPKFDF
jgi:hypothetical protein